MGLDGTPLDDAINRCLADWQAHAPSVIVDAAPFREFLNEGPFEPQHLSSLALAFACSTRSATAIEVFERLYFPAIERTISRNRGLPVEPSDVLQQLRERLFVAKPGSAPGISSYRGRSSLPSWLRVVVARLLTNVVQRQSIGVTDDESVLMQLISPEKNPEMSGIKAQHRAHLKAALGHALKALEPRDRNLLRHRFIDELSLDALSTHFGVSRATVSRWLLQVRTTIFVTVRAALRDRLKSDSELDGLLASVQNSIEINLLSQG